jgi:tetratricopeptide (TPR) repeat protein
MAHDDSTPDEAFAERFREYQDALGSQDVDRATEAVYGIFGLAHEWCEQNPSPEMNLNATANHCERNADWHGAESAYREILALPSLDPATECQAHSDLAALYRLLGRHSDEIEEDSRATAAARRSDCDVLLIMSLAIQARTMIDRGALDDAHALIDEATLLLSPDELYSQLRGSLLVLRAKYSIRAGQLRDAQRDLAQAFDLLKPCTNLEIAAGAHRDLAKWWSISAELHAARNDLQSAVDDWAEAASISTHIASLPHVEGPHSRFHVAEMLLGLAEALRRTGRADEAAEALNEREIIRSSIGLP